MGHAMILLASSDFPKLYFPRSLPLRPGTSRPEVPQSVRDIRFGEDLPGDLVMESLRFGRQPAGGKRAERTLHRVKTPGLFRRPVLGCARHQQRPLAHPRLVDGEADTEIGFSNERRHCTDRRFLAVTVVRQQHRDG